jgi:hypothetical protein
MAVLPWLLSKKAPPPIFLLNKWDAGKWGYEETNPYQFNYIIFDVGFLF